jgi:hypothetical protein
MKFEEQFVSLELALKMKELGFRQDSLFWWIPDQDKKYLLHSYGEVTVLEGIGTEILHDSFVEVTRIMRHKKLEKISAFSIAELGEILHDHIAEIRPCNAGWEVLRFNPLDYKEKKYTQSATLADALAKMLIYLAENGLINPKEL